MTRPAITQMDVTLRGELPPDTRELAVAKLRPVLRQSPEPVLHTRVKITRHGDPAVARPVVAQVNLDLNGRLVRVQASGATPQQAIGEAQAKLRRRLPEFARHREARRGEPPGRIPSGWRPGPEPATRRSHLSQPATEREIVRRKSIGLDPENVDEAVAELDRMDYDFYLFAEQGTGQDSVVYRADPTGYRLAQLEPQGTDRIAPHRTPVTVSEQPAPRLTVAEAVRRLNLTGTPFLFFRGADNGRGCLLYQRYDGHYGLITPVG